jgi:hypothetical protein
MQEILDEFDIIECFEVPGQKLQVGEMTKKQTELFSKFGVTPPELVTIAREFRMYVKKPIAPRVGLQHFVN